MDADTAMGGPAGGFPETRQSALAGARSADPAHRTLSYEAIVSTYWKPVYRYIRLKWNKSNEDAKDLTQSFFTFVIHRNFAAGYDPSKAAFRTYLRVCLDRFLANDRKHWGRLKRSAPMLPLDENLSYSQTLDDCFDREWARAIFSHSVDLLQTRINPSYFEVFQLHDLAEPRPTYAELAAALGLTPVNVTNYLAAARREFRAIMLGRLRAITSDDRELRRETIALLGS